MKIRREMPSILIVAALVLPLFDCGCHKSQREIAEENAIKRHEQDTARVPNVTPAQRAEFLSRPDTKVAFAALNYLQKAKKEGRLPGTPGEEPGGFVCQKKPQFGTDGVNYSTLEVRYVTKTVPRTNRFYILTQVSSNSTPQLQGAWSVAPDRSTNEINIQ
jgi:hypothetical protein